MDLKQRPPKEASIERYLVEQARARGGEALKVAPLSCAGLPARLGLRPGGRVGFSAVKRKGKAPAPVQAWWLAKLTALGFVALWADCREDVDSFFCML